MHIAIVIVAGLLLLAVFATPAMAGFFISMHMKG